MKSWPFAASALIASVAIGQTLPPPTRTVYRCEEAGKVNYSDAPCLGAKLVDVEPTRGLNQTSGRAQVGRDVQRELHRENLAQAAKPITGMTPEQFSVAAHRQPLSHEAKRQCQHLDRILPGALADANNASSQEERTKAQQRLLALRTTFKKTGCG